MSQPAARPAEGSEAPAADDRAYRRALGCFATGVAIVTCALPDGRRAGLTVNSFTSVSLTPPLVSWCLSSHAQSFEIFDSAGHFAVNVLALDQQALVRRFAQREVEKFAGVPTTAGLGDAPLLDGCVARFECRRAGRYGGGDHVVYLGEVERYARFEREPLVLLQGRFGRLDDG